MSNHDLDLQQLLITIIYDHLLLGNNIGSVIMFASGGYLCDNGFDGGWPSIFYIFGNQF